MSLMHPVVGPITSPYGWRTIRGVPNHHNGVDYGWLRADPTGSLRIHAPADGVVDVGFNSSVGKYVAVTTSVGRVRLCHLASIAVQAGQTVKRGQLVGIMGNTGFAIGVHLHLELWRSNVRVNPAPYFTLPFTLTALAGTGSPIGRKEQEDDMRLVKRDDTPTPEWSLFHPSLAGPSPLERGYYLIADPDEALAWARLLYAGGGTEQSEPRDVYVTLQTVARIAHANHRRGLLPPATSVDLTGVELKLAQLTIDVNKPRTVS